MSYTRHNLSTLILQSAAIPCSGNDTHKSRGALFRSQPVFHGLSPGLMLRWLSFVEAAKTLVAMVMLVPKTTQSD